MTGSPLEPPSLRLDPVTLHAPCEFFGLAKNSLRRRVPSGLSGRVTGEHVFFASQGRARKVRPQPQATNYFFADPAEER